MAVGDFNGDGKPDLVVTNLNSADVSVFLGNGNGTFQNAVGYGAGRDPRSVAVGDFNGDGKPDLVVANSGSGNVSVLLNTCVSAAIDLAIARSNSTLTLSWPFPSAGFVLESTTNLSSTNWQPAVEAGITNNGRLEVAVPLNQEKRYFRLHAP